MVKLHLSKWNLSGWYVASTTFIWTHVAALVFYVLGGILNTGSQPVTLNQVKSGGEVGDEIVGLVLFLVCFLMAPWYRYVQSGRNKKSYVFWTCVQGGFVLLFGWAILHKLTSGSSFYVVLTSGVSFLLWLVHTLMIPKHETDKRRISGLDLGRWN